MLYLKLPWEFKWVLNKRGFQSKYATFQFISYHHSQDFYIILDAQVLWWYFNFGQVFLIVAIFFQCSRYCDTINNMVHVCQQKQILPWLQNEFLFQASSYKKPYDKALHALHKFTRTVIYERRKKYQVGSQQNAENTTKGRVSFLGKINNNNFHKNESVCPGQIQLLFT